MPSGNPYRTRSLCLSTMSMALLVTGASIAAGAEPLTTDKVSVSVVVGSLLPVEGGPDASNDALQCAFWNRLR